MFFFEVSVPHLESDVFGHESQFVFQTTLIPLQPADKFKMAVNDGINERVAHWFQSHEAFYFQSLLSFPPTAFLGQLLLLFVSRRDH